MMNLLVSEFHQSRCGHYYYSAILNAQAARTSKIIQLVGGLLKGLTLFITSIRRPPALAKADAAGGPDAQPPQVPEFHRSGPPPWSKAFDHRSGPQCRESHPRARESHPRAIAA